jgi:GxxExxY protein
MMEYTEDERSKIILDAALTVHKKLGPGLLESAYEACLAYEIRKRGIQVIQQKPVPLVYEDVKTGCRI